MKSEMHEGFAFFYCNQNETERQELLSVLRSFVWQLSTVANDEDSMQKGLRQLHIQTRLKGSALNHCWLQGSSPRVY